MAFKILDEEAGEMAQGLRGTVPTGPTSGGSQFLQMWACNFSSRGPDILFWPPWVPTLM